MHALPQWRAAVPLGRFWTPLDVGVLMKCAHDTHLSRLDPRKLLCVARCRRRRRRCGVWRPRHGERWWRRAAPVRSHRRRGRLLLLLQIASICQGCGNNWRRACRCCRYSGGRRRGFRCSPLSLKIIMLLLVASCTTTSICCGGVLLEISGSGSSGRCSRGRRGCLGHLPLCIKVIHVICTTRHTRHTRHTRTHTHTHTHAHTHTAREQL